MKKSDTISTSTTLLYGHLFKLPQHSVAREQELEEIRILKRFDSVLTNLRAQIVALSLNPALRPIVEKQLSRIIADQVKANYTADDVIQMFLGAVDGLNAEQGIVE